MVICDADEDNHTTCNWATLLHAQYCVVLSFTFILHLISQNIPVRVSVGADMWKVYRPLKC